MKYAFGDMDASLYSKGEEDIVDEMFSATGESLATTQIYRFLMNNVFIITERIIRPMRRGELVIE